MADPVISVQQAGKAYRMWDDPASRLTAPLLEATGGMLPGNSGRWLKARAEKSYRDFWALKDVSFEVNKGEAIGIVGRNGSGKSTLLQIIAGTLQPTEGKVTVKGRVTALLELGAGFNVDFTGRENLYLSAAVLGLSRSEIEARFDAIAAFADIGEFIEQPVKTYSSGMMMRLAFAVNTCVDPDVLIVDEALSVGDAPFQAKCFRRLRQLIDQGVSLLFVSHDIGTVRSICSGALWLKNGKAEQWGEAKAVAKEYEKFCWQEQGVQTVGNLVSAGKEPNPPARSTAQTAPRSADWAGIVGLLETHNFLLPVTDPSTRFGNQDVVVEALAMLNAQGLPVQAFDYDETVTVLYRFKALRAVDSDCMIGVRLRDPKGHHVYSIQDLQQVIHLTLAAGETLHVRTLFRIPLTHGDYILRTGIFGFQDGRYLGPDGAYDFSRAVLWDIREDAMHLLVRPNPGMPLAGPVHQHAPFHFSNGSPTVVRLIAPADPSSR